jgi:hypothetical protein
VSSLDHAFDELASGIDDQDWGEVLARAGLRRPLRRLPVVVALLVAVALAATLGARRHRAGAAVPGPQRVERHVPNGTVHWLFAHEPRGESLAAAHIPLLSTAGSHWQPVRFARAVEPAPGVRVALTLIGKKGRNVCLTLYRPGLSAGGGCAFGLELRPFSWMTFSDVPDGSMVAGLASDTVARLRLFLPHGRSRPVPLVANVFAVHLSPAEYPSNLVAYDRSGRVIGRLVGDAPAVLKH